MPDREQAIRIRLKDPADRRFVQSNRRAYDEAASRFIETICAPAGCLNVLRPSTPDQLYQCANPALSARNIVNQFSNNYDCTQAVTPDGPARISANGTVALKAL